MRRVTAEAPAPAPRSDPDEWFSPRRFALLLGLLICATYPDVIFGGNTFFHRDFAVFGYPLAAYQHECFWRGEIPLWTPLSYCGLPFLAQWNTLTLYPPSMFYLVLPLSWSLAVFCLGHLFLGSMGMYFLARRWIENSLAASFAGLAFAFNAVLLHSLMWPNNMAGFGWLPWVVLATERAWRGGGRRIVVAAVVGAMQMLSGAPEVILLTWLFVAALWILDCTQLRTRSAEHRLGSTTAAGSNEPSWHSALLRFLVVVLLVAALAAAQLLPFLDLLRVSQRNEGFSDSTWAMPIWGWANFLVPLFRARLTAIGIYAQPGQFWIQSYYLGIGVATFALLAVVVVRRARVWLLAGVTIACLLVALGDQGIVYGALRRALPGLGFMRFPIKFIILPTALVPLLTAYLVAHVRNADAVTWAKLKRIVFAVAMLLLAGIGGVLVAAFKFPLKGTSADVAMQSGLSRAVLLALFCSALWALREGKPMLQRFAPFWLLALVWTDMFTSGPRPNPGVPRWVYEPGLAARESRMNPLPRVGEGRPMLGAEEQGNVNVAQFTNATDTVIYSRLALFANCNLLDHLPKITGSYSLYFRELGELLAALYAAPEPPAGLLDFLAISQVNAPGRVTQWLPRPSHLPWVTGGQKPVFADGPATLPGLLAREFDPRREVFLPAELRGTVVVTNSSSPGVSTKEFKAGRVRVEVQANEPALVVISQSFSRNWRATVDGQAVPLLRANHAFQAVAVPAGKHELVLQYQDHAFQLGAGISVVTLAGLAVSWRRAKGGAASPAH